MLCLQTFHTFPNINRHNNKFGIQVVDDNNNDIPMCVIKLKEGCYEIKDIQHQFTEQLDVYNRKNDADLKFEISVNPIMISDQT